MKIYYTLCIFLATINAGTAQKFEWVTCASQGVMNPNYAPVAIDQSGNSYTLIRTSQSMPVIIEQDTFQMPGPGTNALCVVKYDPNGVVIWGKMFSSANSYVGDISVDGAGSVYFSGRFDDVNTYATDTVYNNNNFVHQVVKLSTDGEFEKVLFVPNAPSGTPRVVSQGTFVFISTYGTIEKRDSSLNVIWSYSATAGSVAFDGMLNSGFRLKNNLLISTAFEGNQGNPIPFSNDTLDFNLPGPFNEALFCVMDSSGQIQWQYPIPYTSSTSAIAFDNQNNIYAGVCGLNGTFIFGNDTLLNTFNPGTPYSAILKWDVSGIPLYAKPIYSNSSVPIIYDMDVNNNDELIFTYSSFGSIIGSTIMPFNDILVKFDATGNMVWYKTANNNWTIKMDGIRVRNGNEYIVAGGTDISMVTGCIPVNTGNAWGNLVLMVSEQSENYPVAAFTQSVNGFTYQFTDQSQNAVSWYWDFGDGDTSILQNPSHTYASGGNYTVTLTVYNNACFLTTTFQILGLSINEPNTDLFNIAPNPATEHLLISGSVRLTLIRIMDITGKITMEKSVDSLTKYDLDISGLESGCYTVQLISESSVQSSRFVKVLQ